MKKLALKTALVVIFFSHYYLCYSQVKIDNARYIRLYNEGKFSQLFSEVSTLRKHKEYGKYWILDYYLAKTLCATGDFSNARKGFNYILNRYPLMQSQRSFIYQERNSCTNSSENQLSHIRTQLLVNMGSQKIVPAITTGKGGTVIDCSDLNVGYETDPAFDYTELDSRIFELHESKKATAYYRNNLDAGEYKISTYGRFIFITPSDELFTNRKAKDVSERLEKAYKFYSNFFDVRPPDKLIAVYLMGNKERLAKVAYTVHGLKLPSNNIGYSCLADLSILGTSTPKGIGTMYHELFHLIIRTDFGDIPGWLDEGIASLYAESYWEKDRELKGTKKTWRTEVLHKLAETDEFFPNLDLLIRSNWESFTPTEINNICDVSVNYAYSRHFAFYMQEKGWLQKVLNAYKTQDNVFVNVNSNDKDEIAIFEEAVGMSLHEVQKDFDNWLFINYNLEFKR